MSEERLGYWRWLARTILIGVKVIAKGVTKGIPLVARAIVSPEAEATIGLLLFPLAVVLSEYATVIIRGFVIPPLYLCIPTAISGFLLFTHGLYKDLERDC